jgi:hypothetical protein
MTPPAKRSCVSLGPQGGKERAQLLDNFHLVRRLTFPQVRNNIDLIRDTNPSCN